MGVGIEVSNLNAWYGPNHTLQEINLKIPANHATALIGPSGCGKSTFVRCLNRMHETNPIARVTGKVLIGDLDIYADAKPVEIRRRVGMVFQRPNPFPTMSIYDNVADRSGIRQPLQGFAVALHDALSNLQFISEFGIILGPFVSFILKRAAGIFAMNFHFFHLWLPHPAETPAIQTASS